MHLFYNISKDMLRLWCGDGGDDYVLGRAAMRDIDAELRKFGDGIASEVGARPRPITRFKDWKSAELKDFVLRYSLIVLDGYLPQTYLSGWALFVELVDLCWRPVLTEEDISEVGRLARDFYRHYEEHYYKYDVARMNMCKYVFHLILHLEEGIRESGPPVGYSQYWTERYIGWIVGRLRAKNLASASLFKSALFGESYKMYYSEPFASNVAAYEEVVEEGGFQMQGKGYRRWLSYENSADVQFLARLKSYFLRKYDGMTGKEAQAILDGVDNCVVQPRVRFLCGSDTQTASSYYCLRDWNGSDGSSRIRASWHVACEMEVGGMLAVYYGRVLKLVEFEVDLNFSKRWPHWQTKYQIALLEWASGLEVGEQRQVHKNCESEHAFSAVTVEDICIVQRLISVVDHFVPTRGEYRGASASRSTARRGRKRCYFVDDFSRSDRLLISQWTSGDGRNRVLRGRRGQGHN